MYMSDKDEKMLLPDAPLSNAVRLWLSATCLKVDSAAALKATSPQLEAMIERAWILNQLGTCSDDEKQATAEYFKTLEDVKKRAYAERDNKLKEQGQDG